MLVDNMRAIGVLDEHGKQVAGNMIKTLQGMDALFIYHLLRNQAARLRGLPRSWSSCWSITTPSSASSTARATTPARLVPDPAARAARRQPAGGVGGRRGRVGSRHPYVPSRMEEALARFLAAVPHPEIHGGKKQKRIWSIGWTTSRSASSTS
jgi:hypothetical protein